MKLAFSTIGCPDWSLDEIIAAAKDLNYDGVEIRGIGGEIYAPAIKQLTEGREKLMAKLASTGVKISCLTSGATFAIHDAKDASLKEAFAYIDLAKDSLGITKEKLIDRLGEQYDGFSFDRRAQTHVYCPWSVLNFFAKPAEGFQNYWYTSGGQPTVLMKYLNTHALKSPAVYNEDILVSLSELGASRQYDEISTEALLTQSGYLTIKALAGGAFVQLGYPNQEVAESMAALYAEELLKGQNIARSGIPALSRVMAQESVETVVDYFNRALSSIDYVRYPIKDESACRAYLQVLLIGAAMLPRVEVHNALGRCDMEVQAGKRHWVFEFKYTRDDSRVQSLLREASEQITNRRYGSTFNAGELIRVALVFSEKERRFVAWESV